MKQPPKTKRTQGTASIDRHIGERVREYRMRLGVTRLELAQRVGVSHQQFEKYEKGLNRISAGMLVQIAEHLRITPAYFLEIRGKSSHNPANHDQQTCLELSRNFLKISEPKFRQAVMVVTKILAET